MTDSPAAAPPKLAQSDSSVVCETCKSSLSVNVRYGTQAKGTFKKTEDFKPLSDPVQDGQLHSPPDHPIADVLVEISGPVNQSKRTDKKGVATFNKIPPGHYHIKATYDKKSSTADAAEKQNKSTKYANQADLSSRYGYGPGRNKCNLFVYDTLNGAGSSVPLDGRWSRSAGASNYYRAHNPPTADQWGSSSREIGDWTPTTEPQPGDVAGQAVHWDDASGHTAIVGYPNPKSAVKDIDLQVGAATVQIRLQWVSVGAGGSEVHQTEFPYDEEHQRYAHPQPTDKVKGEPPQFHRYGK